MQINDGGTAYPPQDPQAIHAYAIARTPGDGTTEERDRAYTAARAEAVGGMSLRDAFAIAALPTIYAESVRIMEASGFPDENWRDGVAMDVYAMADTMIRARSQEQS